MNIGENLKKIRKDKGITQEKLSSLTKISITSIQRYELGKRQPTVEIINKIADALEISVYDLIGKQSKNIEEDSSGNNSSDETDKINEVVQFMLLSDKIVNSKILNNEDSKAFVKLCNKISESWISNLSSNSMEKVSKIYNLYSNITKID